MTTLRLAAFVLILALGLSMSAAGAETQRPVSRRPPPTPPLQRETTLSDSLGRSRAELQAAVRAYQAALERVLTLQDAELGRASEELERLRGLQERGLVSQREVEEIEARVSAAREKVDETRHELAQTEVFGSETLGTDVAKGAPDEEPVAHPWSLAEVPKIERFFSVRFGRSLPVSALGQTAVHDRMRFDHRNAVDVAVHPDSEEGQALIAYLRRNAVPFIAFRGPVRRAATGAHIHIGEESKRIAVHAPRLKRAAKRVGRGPLAAPVSVKRRVSR